ncbi:MAG: hypothetical protein VX346_03015 [Planctomycetota bacterium]|nr:hypothetical protein [Planctomycetota bacterium]
MSPLLAGGHSRYLGICFCLLYLAGATSPAGAEKAPLSPEALQQEADAILVATIEEIRVQTEAAEYGEVTGNWDWGIYLTLRTESIVKRPGNENLVVGGLEARCFRIKSRRSMQGYLAPSGHAPIPEIGTRVKVFLEQRKQGWAVLLPNGIVPLSTADQPLGKSVPDAQRVVELRSLMYTWLLPLEVWPPVVVIAVVVLLFARWLRRRNGPKSLSQ